ncbi:MAG TPA: DPP IV N-terminal domain-containing protein, partial [Anaerolineales bacterium]|nr:DPP IV N-terminal domain-containing protein [Anaerolineales bacterium]
SDRHEEQGKLTDNIWLMDINGGNLRQLTQSETWENTYPGWSPDGRQIAFFRWSLFGDEEEAEPGLIVLDLDSSEETVLVEEIGFGIADAPVWSPDGEFIAYLSSNLEDSSQILVVPGSGGEPVQITDLDGENYNIAWSPDSQWLTFTHQTDDTIQIYIVDRDGNGLRPLFPGEGNGFGDWFFSHAE